ncbi:MAG: hypothetical protein ABI565_09360 [Vicinamibacteria bacterium]
MPTQPEGEVRLEGDRETALISGVTFTDRPVQYTNRDGVAYFEGDIILGMRFLEAAFVAGLNVLVAGGTQSSNPTVPKCTRIVGGPGARYRA